MSTRCLIRLFIRSSILSFGERSLKFSQNFVVERDRIIVRDDLYIDYIHITVINSPINHQNIIIKNIIIIIKIP